MTTLRRILLAGTCLAVTACASRGSGPSSGQDRLPTTVVVDNQALLDMTIYVLRGGQRIRLGTANAVSKTKFTIPQGIVFGLTTLRFLADPIGSSRTPVSEQITVSEGDEVGLTIPPV